MRYNSVFNVLGRIIVGPSSSHTAGACRIGYIANKIFGKIPKSVNIYLHGSFAETYRGHKTDVALIGGLLGYTPEDTRIPFSFDLASKQNMEFHIKTCDLGSQYHPNSALIEMEDEKSTLSLIGASIGGGNIQILEIDGLEAGFNGNSPTIIEVHKDRRGILAKIMEIISIYGYNVKEMHLSRNIRKKEALSWIEVNKEINSNLIDALNRIKDIRKVRWFNA